MNAVLPIFEGTRHKVTVDELQALLRQGFLSKCERVDLIDGVIVEMPAEGYAHVELKFRITEWLMANVSKAWRVVPESTLRIADTETRSPDIRVEQRNVPFSEITGSDIALIIEIADTSKDNDLKVKPQTYGQFGVIEYWVVDLDAWRIKRFTEKDADGNFVHADTVAAGDAIAPRTLPELSFRLADFSPDA